jgi:hypothetical protein
MLPQLVLERIMGALVAQLEPDNGIIGPSMVAGWLANAALVGHYCWTEHS